VAVDVVVVLEVLVLVGVVILWLVPSVVCFLKGKWVSGLVGIFGIVVGVGWIWACGAAVRLAKPGSVWARRRYFGEKLARARERYPDDASVADAEQEEAPEPPRLGTPAK
jgi:hypothetical protein